MHEVRSRSAEWEVFPDAPAQERFLAPQHRSVSWRPSAGAFPDAPAQERFLAPLAQERVERTTEQEPEQAETLETPDSCPLVGIADTQLLGGQFPWKQVQRLVKGRLFFR